MDDVNATMSMAPSVEQSPPSERSTIEPSTPEGSPKQGLTPRTPQTSSNFGLDESGTDFCIYTFHGEGEYDFYKYCDFAVDTDDEWFCWEQKHRSEFQSMYAKEIKVRKQEYAQLQHAIYKAVGDDKICKGGSLNKFLEQELGAKFFGLMTGASIEVAQLLFIEKQSEFVQRKQTYATLKESLESQIDQKSQQITSFVQEKHINKSQHQQEMSELQRKHDNKIHEMKERQKSELATVTESAAQKLKSQTRTLEGLKRAAEEKLQGEAKMRRRIAGFVTVVGTCGAVAANVANPSCGTAAGLAGVAACSLFMSQLP